MLGRKSARQMKDESLEKLNQILSECKLELPASSQEKLHGLSTKSINVVNGFLRYFITSDILTRELLSALIDKLTITIPPADVLHVEINPERSFIDLDFNNEAITFQLRSSNWHHYWSGHDKSDPEQKRAYLLKKSQDKPSALKEAKYSSFFKNEACVIKPGPYFISTWTEGTPLSTLRFSLDDFTIKERFTWLCSIWKQLTDLHGLWRAHHDLNGGNIIINTSLHQASFIDFEQTKKIRTIADINDDLTSICRKIIPLLFDCIDDYRKEDEKFYIDNPVHYGLREMYMRALTKDENKPSFTSTQAWRFCSWMLENFDSMDTALVLTQATEMLDPDPRVYTHHLLSIR